MATPLDGEHAIDGAGKEYMDIDAEDSGNNDPAEGPKWPPVRLLFRLTIHNPKLENRQN